MHARVYRSLYPALGEMFLSPLLSFSRAFPLKASADPLIPHGSNDRNVCTYITGHERAHIRIIRTMCSMGDKRRELRRLESRDDCHFRVL